jgi:hypothetical protein
MSEDYMEYRRIAELAQKFYEEEGCPEGKALEHWFRAERVIRGEAEPDSSAPPEASDEDLR